MAKKILRSQTRVFSDSYRMETETVYHEDGTIKTFPCGYELGQQITCTGGTVTMKAKVTVDPDGNVSTMPYRRNSGQRYRKIFQTAHGEVKETNEDIIVKLQFRKRSGRYDVCDMMEDEVDDIINYLETTKEVRQWQ